MPSGRRRFGGRPPSIYEHLRAHLAEVGLDEGGQVLPDDEESVEEAGLRFAPGAREGILGAEETDDELVTELHRALVDMADRPGARSRARARNTFARADPLGHLDAVLERLESFPPRDPARLREEVGAIVRESGRRGEVKLALAVLGSFGRAEDVDLLRVFARHEEFTLYAAVALGRIVDDPVPEWLGLLPHVERWGRGALVRLLLDEPSDAACGALLRERWPMTELGPPERELAVASRCDLAGVLERERDRPLIAGARDLLARLAIRDEEGMLAYQDGLRATERLLDVLEPYEAEDHLALEMLRSFALRTFAWEGPDRERLEARRRELGWTPEARARVAARCDELLASDWSAVVEAELGRAHDTFPGDAVALAQDLGVPVRDFLWDWIELHPDERAAWRHLERGADDEDRDLAVELAARVFAVPTEAGPPELRVPEWFESGWVVPGLFGRPGKGWWEVIGPALRSSDAATRRFALLALAQWPPRLVTEEMRDVVRELVDDPDDDARAMAERVLRGEPLYDGRWPPYAAAASFIGPAAYFDEDTAAALARRGRRLFEQGFEQDADADFERAFELDPAVALRARGWMYYDDERYEEALAAFERALETDPASVGALAGCGWARYRLDREEDALEPFGRALELDPEHVGAREGRGWTLYSLGRYEEALADLDDLPLGTDAEHLSSRRVCGWARWFLDRNEEALLDFERVLALEPEDGDALEGLASALHALGRYEEAIEACERLLELEPGHPSALVDLAWSLYELGQYEEALAAFEDAAAVAAGLVGEGLADWEDDEPDEDREDDELEAEEDEEVELALAGAFLGRAWTLEKLGRHEEALADFERTLQLDPESASALDGRGWSCYRLDRNADALESFGKTLELDPRHGDAREGRAWTLYALGRYEEALADFERALELDPESVSALDGRGWSRHRLGRREEALSDFDCALELDPAHVDALCGRGRTYHGLGRAADALADFERALALSPAEDDALCGRGWARYLLRRADEALADFDAALVLAPEEVDGRLGRGWALFALGRHEEALREFGHVLEAVPSHANAWNGRGWAERGLGRHEEALSSFDRALQLAPGYLDALDGRGRTWLRLRRYEDALASFDEALALRAEYVPVLAGRGSTRARLGRYEEALSDAERLLELAPRDPQGFYVRGRARLGLGDEDEALADFDRALELDGSYGAALAGRGAALHRLGRHDEALRDYDAALAVDPGLRDGLLGRSRLHADRGRFAQALADAESALAHDPSDEEAEELRTRARRAPGR